MAHAMEIVKKRSARLIYHLRGPVAPAQQLGPPEGRGWVYWAENVSR
jgi:hypothetical protein